VLWSIAGHQKNFSFVCYPPEKFALSIGFLKWNHYPDILLKVKQDKNFLSLGMH
jgi:hypothetical protein